jgi:hypothetical protein
MAIGQTSYELTPEEVNWGICCSGSGPYVLVSQNATEHGFWLYKRDASGVLQQILAKWTPTVYPVVGTNRWFGYRTSCWYDKAGKKLDIIVSAYHDTALNQGAVWFLEWPDSGAVAGDMVERSKIVGSAGDKLGLRLAIADGRAMALADAAGSDLVRFYSRNPSTNVWTLDRSAGYQGVTTQIQLELWSPSADGGVVWGVIGQRDYSGGTHTGRVSIVKSTGPGNTWSDPQQLDSDAANANYGRGCAIGPGVDGAGTIITSDNDIPRANYRGVSVFNLVSGTWTKVGDISDTISFECISCQVGYNLLSFGDNSHTKGGDTRVGAANVTIATGGSWDDLGGDPTYYLQPTTHQAVEDGTWDQSIYICQEENRARVGYGSTGWDVIGSGVGRVIEYEGDADWPLAPTDHGARLPLPSVNLDLVSTEAPLSRIVLINCYPEHGESRVKAGAILHLTVASLDNVALATTTKVYIAIDGGQEELVYDQGGTGFQAGWNGSGSSATVQQSPGSGVNDELVLAIDKTADYPSEAEVTVFVEAATA